MQYCSRLRATGLGSPEIFCNWPQMLNPPEIEELLEELGSITMDCEFCNQQYRFAREDLEDVLGGEGSATLH